MYYNITYLYMYIPQPGSILLYNTLQGNKRCSTAIFLINLIKTVIANIFKSYDYFINSNFVVNDDYSPGPYPVVLEVNDTDATVGIPIIDDSKAEGNEKFRVTFEPPVKLDNYTKLCEPCIVTVVIKDDDHPHCK